MFLKNEVGEGKNHVLMNKVRKISLGLDKGFSGFASVYIWQEHLPESEISKTILLVSKFNLSDEFITVMLINLNNYGIDLWIMQHRKIELMQANINIEDNDLTMGLFQVQVQS